MKWILALCLLFSSPADSGGVYIGNGGQGVKANGKIYLRDLYQAGLLEPEFGPDTSKPLLKRLNASRLARLDLDMQLTARKLTDLAAHIPGFPSYFISAIEYYNWQFTNEELPQVNAEDPSGNYVTLALRKLNVIRVHRPSWLSLSPEHRVALVIHELVSAMTIPICDQWELCAVSNQQVRSRVALMFRPLAELRADLFTEFSSQFPDYSKSPIEWMRNAIDLPGFPGMTFEGMEYPRNIVLGVARICAEIIKTRGDSPVHITFYRYPFDFQIKSYRTQYMGTISEQTFLAASFASPMMTREFGSGHRIRSDRATCERELIEVARSWYSYR
jgi:hypothetical protein